MLCHMYSALVLGCGARSGMVGPSVGCMHVLCMPAMRMYRARARALARAANTSLCNGTRLPAFSRPQADP